MKTRVWFLFFIILVAGCSRPTPTPSPTETPQPTSTLRPVPAYTTRTPDVRDTVRQYLDAWQRDSYSEMYALLTSLSRDAITEEEFTSRYRNVASEAALSPSAQNENFFDYEILSALTTPHSAQVSYRLVLHSLLVGDIHDRTIMNLSLENGAWQVQWEDTLILSYLAGGNRLAMEYLIPSRANIYDRDGRALVAQSDAVALGIDTTKLDPEYDNTVLNTIFSLTGIRPDTLRPEIENYRQNGWYLAVTDLSADVVESRMSSLSSLPGLVLTSFRSRYYFDGGPVTIAPHVTGYRSLIQVDEVEHYKRLGYRQDEWVGRAGLEYWGEPYLAGQRGGILYVVGPDGKVITKLAESGTAPAQAIYTTLDREFQEGVQATLNGLKGAAVVLERDTGRVLAMASSPGFNPNLFEPTNANSKWLLNTLYSEDLPILNRATQGLYPLGSVFKIVTMAAGLESGLYTAETEYTCGYFFEELDGYRPHDWTYGHYLEDGETQPSGLLSLPQGLMRSCNPWFQHIGLDLYNRGMTTSVSDMANALGLGIRTGIEIEEEAGAVPEPTSQTDAVNLAIGQGNTQVTALQVASMVAAIGNGGTLYEPHVVERIAPPDGEPTYVFTPTVRSQVPISPENLEIIQDAMVSVFSSKGTAPTVGINLRNSNIPAAGKTGTAETGFQDPHAWFAGYTYAGREGKPDIAVAVVLEYQGEGSEWAAPVFQGILQLYYYGQRSAFPWESLPGVWRTATPEVTDTPEVEESPTSTPED